MFFSLVFHGFVSRISPTFSWWPVEKPVKKTPPTPRTQYENMVLEEGLECNTTPTYLDRHKHNTLQTESEQNQTQPQAQPRVNVTVNTQISTNSDQNLDKSLHQKCATCVLRDNVPEDLKQLLDQWSRLPHAIKRAIISLVGSNEDQ